MHDTRTAEPTGTEVPVPHAVVARHRETSDVVTIDIVAEAPGMLRPEPGQFLMLYAFGVGEAPISVAGCPDGDGVIRHTFRAAGAVTHALAALREGDALAARGPFGTAWPEEQPGGDLLVVGGGIGVPPLRPVIERYLRARGLGTLRILVGARRPDDVLYRHELPAWEAVSARTVVTVDAGGPGWDGPIGFVTDHLDVNVPHPDRTTALICGPEIMQVRAATRLVELGVPAGAVHVSLERNMHCADGQCGHCQLGPFFVCVDGPVVPWDRAASLLETPGW